MTQYLRDTYDVGFESAYFGTGSGLSKNYTTCALTLRVIRHLEHTLKQNGLSMTDIIAVPRIDPGVLHNRSIDAGYAKALVAKSGFVNFHHALAGVMNTNKGSVYFGIFTTFDTMEHSAKTKTMIDLFINDLLDTYRRILQPFAYSPDGNLFNTFAVLKR